MFSLIKFSASTPGSVPGPEFNFIGNLSLGGRGNPPAQPKKLGIPWDDLQPTFDLFSVMRWSTRVSRFVGRDEEMDALRAWATGPQTVSAKFVVAPGGMGKTRLAAEFAQQMIAENWSAGFVRLNEPISFYVSKHGLLLLVDYPEQHPKETRELLENLSALGTETRVRVLLLSRSDPDEWTDVLNESHVRAKVDMQPLPLKPLRGEAAHNLYTSALERLQDQFGLGGGAISVKALDDWVKQSPENERALFVLAASVYEATTPGDAEIKYTGREIVTTLADREIQRLREAATSVGLDGTSGTHPDGLARLVAMAAMHGPVPLKTVQAWAANQDLKLGLGDAEMIAERLKDVHLAGRWVVEGEAAGTAASDAAPLVVKPPEPDIVAAALLHMVLFAPDKDDPVANPERLWAATEPDPGNAFSRIERLADDLHYVLGRDTTPLRNGLERMVAVNMDRCQSVYSVVSGDIGLTQVFLPLACIACRELLLHTEDLSERSKLNHDLSIFEESRGDTAEALKASEEAVKMDRALTDENPTRYRLDLAHSLNNLSIRYSNLGRHDEALKANEEAVNMYRALAEENPARYRADLARSLNNLSILYSNLGLHDDALKANEEAVKMYRALAEENPARYRPDLAQSLNNLSVKYSNLGRHDEALEANEEAVQIRRALTEENPARYRPDLATSLNNLSIWYSNLGRHDEALKANEEALEMYRALANENPARYRPDLADSLNNLSIYYSNLGRHDEALEAIEEAIRIWRVLADENPVRFNADLGGSLHGRGRRLLDLNRPQDACASWREAKGLLRPYAEKWPDSMPGRWYTWVVESLKVHCGG